MRVQMLQTVIARGWSCREGQVAKVPDALGRKWIGLGFAKSYLQAEEDGTLPHQVAEAEYATTGPAGSTRKKKTKKRRPKPRPASAAPISG